MKKMFVLFLSVVMLYTLTIPALAAPADDLDPPLWSVQGYESYEDAVGFGWYTEEEYAQTVAFVQAYMSEHPDQTAQFRANAYDYFEEAFYGYESVEEFCQIWNETEEEFVSEMVIWQILDIWSEEKYVIQWEALCEEQPEHVALFLEELDGWFAAEYPWYDSVEEYRTYWDQGVEETYLELFQMWNWDYEWNQAQEQARQEYLLQQGGVPGQLNVMVNGQCLDFPAERPAYAEGGVTYVDARTLYTALGVDAPVGVNGYTGLRAAAASVGCLVFWDGDFGTAVVVDPAALAGQIDGEFTILNKLLAGWKQPEGNYRTDGDCTVEITLFDSLDGDKKTQLSGHMDIIASKAGASGTVSYDLSGLMDLMGSLDDTDPDFSQAAAQLLPLLSGTIQMREDLVNGVVYYSMPALNALLREQGVEIAGDAWLSVSLEELGVAELSSGVEQLPSVGALVAYLSLLSSDSPVYYYENALVNAQELAKVAGDGQFVRQGNAQVLTIDLDTLGALMDVEEGDWAYYDLPQEFSFTLTVYDSGAAAFNFAYRTPEYSYYSESDMRISASGSVNSGSFTATLEYHVKNQIKMTVTLQGNTAAASQAPQTTPPADAPVVPMEELGGF